MAEVSEYLYKIQPTRLEMLTQGPTPDEAAIVADQRRVDGNCLLRIRQRP